MKKFFVTVGIVLLLLVELFLFQKPSVVDVTEKYKDNKVFGHIFITQKNLLVFQYSDSKDQSLGLPGADMPRIDELPVKLPCKWYGNTIYGFLPAGSQFKIVGAKRSTSKTMGHDWYMVEIQSDGLFKGRAMSTSDIEIGGSYIAACAVEKI